MRLIMTLLVRDEEAIVRENIEYHLDRGVDFIIATDNLSRDGTADILREYERAGVLRYLHEAGDDHSQDLWVSRMADLATTEHGADWLIHVDADEFWWPETDTDLRRAFLRIPSDLPAILVPRCNFIRASGAPESFQPGSFHRALRWRERDSLNPLGQPLPGKVAHRGLPEVALDSGNHGLRIAGRRPHLPRCESLTVFHFPLRDVDQYRSKIRHGATALERNTRLHKSVGITWRELLRLEQAGTLEAHLQSQLPGTEEIARRVESGELVPDLRFACHMDALLARKATPAEPVLPSAGAGAAM